MKTNIIKKSLSVIVISLLMCLIFVSCKDTSKELKPPNKENQTTTENQKESTEKEKNEEELTEGDESLKEEINKEEVNKDVTQENEKVETEQKEESQPANKEEDVKVEEDVYGQMICIINDIYLSNDKKYIDIDQVEFFTGEEAYAEAAKDGKLYKDENGNDFLPNGYYIRNNYNNIETFEVSEESVVNLCIYIVDPSSTGNSSETVPVSYEEFEVYINNSKSLDSRSRIFWIDTKNDVVEKIEMQFTP